MKENDEYIQNVDDYRQEVDDYYEEYYYTFGQKLWIVIKDFIYIPICAIIAYLVVGVVFVITIIPTASMEPTYEAGSAAIGFRLVDKENIDRGTSVVFRYTEDINYVKRIIGLPGDTVSFKDGAVYINGSILDESEYLDESVRTYSDVEEFVVPENCYFMLGDNRPNSYDSRYWDNPFVPCGAIIGEFSR